MKKGALTEKWIQGVSPADRTSDVAVRTLAGPLGAVLYYLPLAAEKADEDLEHVHQLRVWTRRATAALRSVRGFDSSPSVFVDEEAAQAGAAGGQ